MGEESRAVDDLHSFVDCFLEEGWAGVDRALVKCLQELENGVEEDLDCNCDSNE